MIVFSNEILTHYFYFFLMIDYGRIVLSYDILTAILFLPKGRTTERTKKRSLAKDSTKNAIPLTSTLAIYGRLFK